MPRRFKPEMTFLVTGYDGNDYWERTMTRDEAKAINVDEYDHVLNTPADRLDFRTAPGSQVSIPLQGAGMGPVCLNVLHAVQLNAGTLLAPADVADLLTHDHLRENNNLSRHVSLLRKVHREPVRAPWFFVTRRSAGFAVMWSAERTWIRVERSEVA